MMKREKHSSMKPEALEPGSAVAPAGKPKVTKSAVT